MKTNKKVKQYTVKFTGELVIEAENLRDAKKIAEQDLLDLDYIFNKKIIDTNRLFYMED